MFAIKRMRENWGRSQQEAADALGISIRRYGGWEREEREINLRDAIRLADLFECTLDELAGRDWPSEALTAEESELVEGFRSSDPRGREAIMDTARREAGASRREATTPPGRETMAPPGVA